MPEITGVELAREILAIQPELPVILCTEEVRLEEYEATKFQTERKELNDERRQEKQE